MSEVSKVPNTVLLIKDQRACRRCWRCEILYCKIKRLCMSEVSKVVFVAFTQHCIQSTVTHVRGVKGCTLYTVASHPCQFLKLRGTQQPGNSYISMGTKLHPPYPNQDCLPVFWSEKCLQCLKNVGLYNSFGIGRFSLWQSWLTRASRLPNSQASASKAGCQVTQTHLSLISHTWPLFDQSRSCTPCVPPAQLTMKLVLVWLIK